MVVQQGGLAKRRAGRRSFRLAANVAGVLLITARKLPVRFAVRALVGRDSGPRGYKRERFPEAQWQQIMAGKRNWFD